MHEPRETPPAGTTGQNEPARVSDKPLIEVPVNWKPTSKDLKALAQPGRWSPVPAETEPPDPLPPPARRLDMDQVTQQLEQLRRRLEVASEAYELDRREKALRDANELMSELYVHIGALELELQLRRS